MTGTKSRFGLERQGMRHLGTQHWNQSMPVLYEHAIRRGEGETRVRRQLLGLDRPLYRPHAARQVHRRGTGHQGHGVVGQDQPAGRPRALRQPAPAHARLPPGSRDLCPGPLCRRRSGLPAAGAGGHRQCLAQPLFAQHVHPPAGRRARRLRAGLHDPARAEIPRHPGVRPDQLRRLHLRQFRRAAGADRRHRLRRRDQEVGIRLSQFRAAGARRAADARFGQCRPEGRLRDLLRALRHRQDDAFGRQFAHPDR